MVDGINTINKTEQSLNFWDNTQEKANNGLSSIFDTGKSLKSSIKKYSDSLDKKKEELDPKELAELAKKKFQEAKREAYELLCMSGDTCQLAMSDEFYDLSVNSCDESKIFSTDSSALNPSDILSMDKKQIINLIISTAVQNKTENDTVRNDENARKRALEFDSASEDKKKSLALQNFYAIFSGNNGINKYIDFSQIKPNQESDDKGNANKE